MKNYIFLFIFFIYISSHCQTYKPLLDNSNQWNFTTCNFGCLTDIYYTDGDTIVNNLNYKILDGFHFISRTFLLRESVADKKVFLTKINENSISEYLLYDFSLQEGDFMEMTNPISPFPLHGGQFVLDSIRTKPLLNNVGYKHFYFSPSSTNQVSNYPVVWVEGIGSKSLINAPGGFPDSNGVGELSCFFKNQNLVYTQSQNNVDCTLLNIKAHDIDSIKISITNQKNVFSISDLEKITSITIYDFCGKNTNYTLNDFKKNKTLNLNNLKAGLYFITVENLNFTQKTFKVIIQ